MEDEWKALGEEWGHPHPLAHRGLGLDEDLRAGDSISPSLGMPVDYMAQHRTGDYGGMRRSEQRSALPGGSEPFYNGRGQGNGAATFNGANGKEDTGFGMLAPNLANSLENTSLGNYLTSEARAVSAPHRQVLVKVVCNYRRTDDLNPGGRPSPAEATNNRCKTILAFQEGNGTHLCFGMFVKEYNDLAQVYIDSVDSTPLLEGENGEDRQKTMTSIVLAYMNHAKLRGFKRLYLRVAPPTDENSFIFTRRLPNVRFRASMHLSLWFKYIVQAASRNGIVHSSKWSTSAVELEFPTWMLREDDHHAEEAYRAMTASLVQAQQGAKDLVGHANRLQDRFFCVYLHNPLAKVKAVEDDGITVESVTMRDRMSFAEVCLRHHLRFNLAEASAKSSRVLIGMISAEQQDGAQSQQQQQQQLMLREGSGNVPSSAAPPSSEEARQRDVPAGYIEGEQEMLGSSAFLGSQAHDGARLAGGSGRGHGRGAAHEHLSGGGARQSDYEMYKEMEGRHGRGMGGMPVGGMHGMAHPSDVAAFYGYHPHIDGMMAGGYVPSHRMPYGAMHGGYPPEMYAGAMEDMKHTHAKHAAMGVPPGMGGHMHPDARWSAGVPRMAGRGGMWQHPASARDVMRNMGLAGRFSRDGVDPRMLDAHGFGYDPSYAGHVGPSPHMTPSSHEMHMMHAMAGGAGTWGAGAMPGGMSRKPQGSAPMAGGRGGGQGPGAAPAGKAASVRRRGSSGGGNSGVVTPAGMSPGNVMQGYGVGDGDEAAVHPNVYADGVHDREQYEPADVDRKRSVEEMERGAEEEEAKRRKMDDDTGDKPNGRSPAMEDAKGGQDVPEADVDTDALQQHPDAAEPEFLEADSFLAGPSAGAP